MKQIITISLIGILIISGLGAGSYNDADSNEIKKVTMPTKYDIGIISPNEFFDDIQPLNNKFFQMV